MVSGAFLRSGRQATSWQCQTSASILPFRESFLAAVALHALSVARTSFDVSGHGEVLMARYARDPARGPCRAHEVAATERDRVRGVDDDGSGRGGTSAVQGTGHAVRLRREVGPRTLSSINHGTMCGFRGTRDRKPTTSFSRRSTMPGRGWQKQATWVGTY